MTPRELKTLASVFVALCLAALAGWWISRPEAAPTFAPAGTASKAARLQMSGPGGFFSITRSSGTWRAETPVAYAADPGVAELLERLTKASVSETLTEDASRYALFGLAASSATALHLTDDAGRVLLDVQVGNDGPDYPSLFFRRSGAAAVQEARGVSAAEWTRPFGDWLDRTLNPAAPASVSSLSVRDERGSTRRVPASDTAALAAVAGLEAERAVLASKDLKPGFEKPSMVLRLETKDGGRVTFVVGAKNETGLRYVRKDDEPRLWFLVSDWKFDALRPKKTPPQAKPQGTR